MKKVIIILSCVAFFVYTNTSKAQKNFPFPSDNPFWTEEHGQLWFPCECYGANGPCYDYYCNCNMPVYYRSDTIINDST